MQREITLAAFWTETLKHTINSTFQEVKKTYTDCPLQAPGFQDKRATRNRHKCSNKEWRRMTHCGVDRGRLKVSPAKTPGGNWLPKTHRGQEVYSKPNLTAFHKQQPSCRGKESYSLKGHREGTEREMLCLVWKSPPQLLLFVLVLALSHSGKWLASRTQLRRDRHSQSELLQMYNSEAAVFFFLAQVNLPAFVRWGRRGSGSDHTFLLLLGTRQL